MLSAMQTRKMPLGEVPQNCLFQAIVPGHGGYFVRYRRRTAPHGHQTPVGKITVWNEATKAYEDLSADLEVEMFDGTEGEEYKDHPHA